MSYLGGLLVVADQNAADLLLNADVGPPVVAATFAVMFLPSACTAVAILRRMRTGPGVRTVLAFLFGALVAVVAKLIFVPSQWDLVVGTRRSEFVMAAVFGANVFFVVTFFFTAGRIENRFRRPDYKSK